MQITSANESLILDGRLLLLADIEPSWTDWVKYEGTVMDGYCFTHHVLYPAREEYVIDHMRELSYSV